MKIISILALIFLITFTNSYIIPPKIFTIKDYFQNVIAEICPESLAVQCMSDLELTLRACSKSVDTQGKDIQADIKCVKDLLADKKNCWPCICKVAKDKGIHVIGCEK